MDAGVKCPLCGLSADSLPRRPRDEQGVSCKRCGDFYIDGLLTYKSPLSDDQRTAILSGYARWATVLGKAPVEINTANIDEIVEGHSQLTQYDKADLLLKFFSIKEPRPGHYINFDVKLDLPIIYSADDNEFSYLISDFAYHELGYLEYVARFTVKITPSGWKRINWIKRIDLASEKFELTSANIDAETNIRIDSAKEKAGLDGTRYSSGLARQIGAIILESAKLKLETKLKIDKEIIFGTEVISDPDSASLLSDRIKSFWEKEKEVVQNILKKNYEDCHGMSYYESAKERFLGEVEKEIRLLQIDLRTRENNDKEGQVEKKNVLEKIEIPDPKRVLVVYGRNGKARRALFDLLRAVSLDPFEWGEAVKETKKGSPYIGEVLEEAFNKAQAVVILLTGDDVACLREEYINPSDAQHERTLSPQARLNVIFEAGRAFGTHPDRTILVELEKEQTRPFSDIGGRHVVRMSNLPKKRMELVERLKTAGCKISTEGRTDWLDTGDFDGAALSMEPVAEGKKGIKKDVASDVEPISNFLRILEETPELGYSTKTLEIYYHDHRELIRLIKYCIDRSFIRAEPIETDQEGTVDFQGIEITALGKGYLHRQG